jgi:hypothetical protein
MTCNAARIGLAIAGAALAAGTTLGAAAAPALAAAPEHGTATSTATVSPRWDHGDGDNNDDGARWDQGRSWAGGDSWDSGATWSAGASWSEGSSYSRGHGWDRSGGWGWDNDDRDGDRVSGFFRSYGQCQRAGYFGALRGAWDDFSCDFTRRGWDGWNNFDRFGPGDWRWGGTWVLRVDDLDED